MRVIIVGCGRVGSDLANTLSAERHEVVVIDKTPGSFSRLSREYTGRMLTGLGSIERSCKRPTSSARTRWRRRRTATT